MTLRNFSPQTVDLSPHCVNVGRGDFAWSHAYCGMHRAVVTYYKFIYKVQVTVCVILGEEHIHPGL